jgi:hypothetical protein
MEIRGCRKRVVLAAKTASYMANDMLYTPLGDFSAILSSQLLADLLVFV